MNFLTDGGIIAVLILIALIAVIVIGILILLRLAVTHRRQQELAIVQRQLQDEIDRSRQDTVDMVQSSVRHMGELLARGQTEAAEAQSRRLGELNREMNSALHQVSRSLGEMRDLASGVDDLKKVLSNVKTRGILGEVQLGAILEDVLAKGGEMTFAETGAVPVQPASPRERVVVLDADELRMRLCHGADLGGEVRRKRFVERTLLVVFAGVAGGILNGREIRKIADRRRAPP